MKRSSRWCPGPPLERWGHRLWGKRDHPGLLVALCGLLCHAHEICHRLPVGWSTRLPPSPARWLRCLWMAAPAGSSAAQRPTACRDPSSVFLRCFSTGATVWDVPGASSCVAVAEGAEGAIDPLIGQLSFITWWGTHVSSDVDNASERNHLRRRKTCGHVRDGSGCGLGIRRPRGVQVPQHVDVRGKVDHVLFPTAMRHPDQILQAIDGWTENVAFGTNQTTIYLIYHVQILILAIQLESGRG